ncbi:hypothetical protein, partial [Mesorhizobium sp.]|uniref:hypothetical protein n=1 Tax=Mesorhizobium sp. TaxID=1871066 RepID=UPI0025B7D80F
MPIKPEVVASCVPEAVHPGREVARVQRVASSGTRAVAMRITSLICTRPGVSAGNIGDGDIIRHAPLPRARPAPIAG